MKTILKLISNLSLLIIVGCCSTLHTNVLFNSHSSPQQLRAYHDSGRYQQEFDKKIHEAQTYLVERAQYYHSKNQYKLALVLDIDETSLSNYDMMTKRDFKATKEQLHEEDLRATTPEFKSTLALYQTALKEKISVFFITGRPASERKATILNLRSRGYKQWAGLYFRPTSDKAPSVVAFKSGMRAKIEKQGYIVIESIGDQYSDINGGYAEKGFKLPNPFYTIP